MVISFISNLCTNTIHNACYNLLRRYRIPIDNLEVHYENKRNRVSAEQAKTLKRKGYCQVDDSSFSGYLKATEVNNKLLTNKKLENEIKSKNKIECGKL